MALWDINSVFLDPCENLLEIPAFMKGVEVGVRVAEAMDPSVSDYPCVSNTHQVLPQNLDAMISQID